MIPLKAKIGMTVGVAILPVAIIIFLEAVNGIFAFIGSLVVNGWQLILLPLIGLMWKVWVKKDRSDLTAIRSMVRGRRRI